MNNKTNLSTLPVEKLKEIAKKMGLEDAKSKSKSKLIETILANDTKDKYFKNEKSIDDKNNVNLDSVKTKEKKLEDPKGNLEVIEGGKSKEVNNSVVEESSENNKEIDGQMEIKVKEDGTANVEDQSQNEIKIETTSNFDLTSVQITMIDIRKLEASKLNFFNPLNAKKYAEVKESIVSNGIMMPLIVRDNGTGVYEILAGHNRKRIAEELGLAELPCKIVSAENVDDEKAEEIIIDTNVNQRTEFSPIELARAYAKKKDIIGKRQGMKNGELSGLTRDIIAQEYGKSGMTIDRYIRLMNLEEHFMAGVDNGTISTKLGMDLALLTMGTQKNLYNVIKSDSSKLTPKLVKELKALAKETKSAAIPQADIKALLQAQDKPKEVNIESKEATTAKNEEQQASNNNAENKKNFININIDLDTVEDNTKSKLIEIMSKMSQEELIKILMEHSN